MSTPHFMSGHFIIAATDLLVRVAYTVEYRAMAPLDR